MYSVNAITYSGATFEEKYIDFNYALMIFNTACECVDCETANLCDATTGECVLMWDGHKQALVDFNCDTFTFEPIAYKK